MNYTTIYHVAPADHSGDLVSLYRQYGEEAYEMYASRWPEAGELAQYHVYYLHCYATLEEAQGHTCGGKIYAIDVDAMEEDYYTIEVDRLEFPHPMVRDSIPAEYLREVA